MISSKVLTLNNKRCLFLAINLTDWNCQMELGEKLSSITYEDVDDVEADAENIVRNLENNYESSVESTDFNIEAEISAIMKAINSQIEEVKPDCVFVDCVCRILEDESETTKNIASKLGMLAKENGIDIFFYSKLFGEYKNMWLPKSKLQDVKLEQLADGLQKSDLIILAARPSMGKSTLALNLAANMALRENKGVAIFSLESSKNQLVQRLLCSEGVVDSKQTKSGSAKIEDLQKFTDTITEFLNAPIYIDDTSGESVSHMATKCRKLKLKDPSLGLIIVDYLQLIDCKPYTDRAAGVKKIFADLKALAKEIGVPILALSQLSRKVEQRDNRRPIITDFEGFNCGANSDIDVVMFLYRDEYYNSEAVENRGKAELIVAKNKHGSTGIVELNFQANICKFTR